MVLQLCQSLVGHFLSFCFIFLLYLEAGHVLGSVYVLVSSFVYWESCQVIRPDHIRFHISQYWEYHGFEGKDFMQGPRHILKMPPFHTTMISFLFPLLSLHMISPPHPVSYLALTTWPIKELFSFLSEIQTSSLELSVLFCFWTCFGLWTMDYLIFILYVMANHY